MNLLKEILNTFSNQKSFFSSKRLERFLVFMSMLICTVAFLVYHIFNCTIDATGLMLIVAGWLGYAGFNTIQIKKDNVENNESK